MLQYKNQHTNVSWFLYTDKKLKKISENNFIYNSIKKNKILGNTFNQGDEVSHTEKNQTLLNEIKGDLNKCKDTPCSWANSVKMAIFPKLVYRFSAIPIQNLMACGFLQTLEKLILKFIWNWRDPKEPKQSWKRAKLEESHFLISKFITQLQ